MLAGFLGHHQDPQMSPGSPSITGVPWCHLVSPSIILPGFPAISWVPWHCHCPQVSPWHCWGPLASLWSSGAASIPGNQWGPLVSPGCPSTTGVPKHHQGPLASPSISIGSPSIPGVPKHPCSSLASPRASLQVSKHCQGPQALPDPPAVPIPIPSTPSGWQQGRATVPASGVTGPAVLRSAEPVALGRWHRVMAERVHKDGTLVVDGGAPVQRSSPGKSQGLNLRSPLYLGGVEPPLQPPTNASFQGCIGEVSPGPPPHTLYVVGGHTG